MAKLAPTKDEDSTWSLDDARNSAIVYKPSDVANASGPSILFKQHQLIPVQEKWFTMMS